MIPKIYRNPAPQGRVVGPIDQLWAELLIWNVEDDTRGAYYCGCRYVAGQENCPHHGDPVERWPEKSEVEHARD